MSLLSSTKCVLILNDEGLQVYNVSRASAQFIDFVPWETEDFVPAVKTLIVKKCKRAPVIILNDMVEQHYRKERIPNASFFDKANILKRRLNVAFPNYRVRAALKLKDKRAKLEKGNSYLFAAVPSSDAFVKTMEVVKASNAQIVGFYLLPVEGAALVRDLSNKINKGSRHKAAWTIFIGQHHGGGLRQIVTRDGELALTRLTPIVDTDVEPELWAKEVAGELDATMSYLSRFGYNPIDGLDIIVISNEITQASLEKIIDVDCDLHMKSSEEAAKLLGVRLGGQEDLRYADPLHTAYLAKKSKFVLPMQSQAIDRLTKPRRIASMILMALLLGGAYLGYELFTNVQKNAEVTDQLMVARQQNKTVTEEYNSVVEKQKALGFDFKLVNNSLEIYEDFENQKMKPLPIIREVGRSLGTDLKLDKFNIKIDTEEKENDDPYAYVPEGEEKEMDYFVEAVMTISFPSNAIDPDVGVEKINDFRDTLQGNLSGYTVRIIKQIADLSYTGNFVGGSGDSGNTDNSVPERYDAEIQVRGLLK